MNYEKLYYSIIKKAKQENRKKNKIVLFENHHIIPKSIGGDNGKDNLILLTPKEHYICHKLLVEMYRGTIHEHKMYFAMWCMVNGFGNQKRYATSSKIYERMRKEFFYKLKFLIPKYKKEVSQYSMDGTYIQTFDSVRLAAKLCGLNSSAVEACARGENKSSGGFNWKYTNSDKIISKVVHKKSGRKKGGNPWNKGKKMDKICHNSKKILQFSLKGEFIKEWDCIFVASKELNINRNGIENCATQKTKSSGGFNWRYLDSTKEIVPIFYEKPGRKLGSIPWNKKNKNINNESNLKI
jgi:hypothetical protein